MFKNCESVAKYEHAEVFSIIFSLSTLKLTVKFYTPLDTR